MILLLHRIIFGILIILAELRMTSLLKWFSFLTFFAGLGAFYVFVGGIACGSNWYEIALAVLLCVIGFIYSQSRRNAHSGGPHESPERSSDMRSNRPPPLAHLIAVLCVSLSFACSLRTVGSACACSQFDQESQAKIAADQEAARAAEHSYQPPSAAPAVSDPFSAPYKEMEDGQARRAGMAASPFGDSEGDGYGDRGYGARQPAAIKSQAARGAYGAPDDSSNPFAQAKPRTSAYGHN